MSVETQADFARRIGVGRSRVHAYKQAGRLVMVDDLVDAESSIARIAETRNTTHDDQSTAKVGADSTALEPIDTAPRRIDSQARIDHARAEMAEIDLEERRGELLRRNDVVATMANIITTLRTRLESVPPQLGPQVAAISDESVCTAIIANQIGLALEEMAHNAGKVGF